MKKYEQLIQILLEKNICTIDELMQILQVSERSIRNLLQELRRLSHRCGFRIVTKNRLGYRLEVEDQVRFTNFQQSMEDDEQYDSIHKTYRISMILYFLLQQKDFTSLQRLADILDVSRNTILNDMKEVREIIKNNHMELIAKKRYGVKINGDENTWRKLFSSCATELHDYPDITQEYFDFCKQIADDAIRQNIIQVLNNHELTMPLGIVDSILVHIKVLLFRVFQGNYIHDLQIQHEMIDQSHSQAAHEIVLYLQHAFGFDLPQVEEDFLASQLIGKANTENVPEKERELLLLHIQTALQTLDIEFSTDFRNDDHLLEALLFHVYPLLKRISFGLVLQDPLIDIVSMQYANSFLIALRFQELLEDLKGYKLSRDEIGFLALHFATHQETEKQTRLIQIKYIIVLCEKSKGTISLMKSRLLHLFPQAKIQVHSFLKADMLPLEEADLILSTREGFREHEKLPIICVSELLDNQDLKKISELVLSGNLAVAKKPLEGMFHEDLFFIESSCDYLTGIQLLVHRLIEHGYVKEGFYDSVLEREQKFTTIYKNGVAGPHGMKQCALKDSIGVMIFTKPILYEEKEVRCIFLINTVKGHLFVHQEVSELLLKIMVDLQNVKDLQQVQDFAQFTRILKQWL